MKKFLILHVGNILAKQLSQNVVRKMIKALNILFEFSKTCVIYLSVCVLGALAKLRKATISFVMYVRSFFCKQLGPNWKDFRENLYLSIFLIYLEKIQFSTKFEKNNG